MRNHYAPHGSNFWSSSATRGRSFADSRLGRFLRLSALRPSSAPDDASSQASTPTRRNSSTDSLCISGGAPWLEVAESTVYARGRAGARRRWLGSEPGEEARNGGEKGDEGESKEAGGRERRVKWKFAEYGACMALFRVVFMLGFAFAWLWKWVRRWTSPSRKAMARRRASLLTGLEEAVDFTEWYYISAELDELEGRGGWKKSVVSKSASSRNRFGSKDSTYWEYDEKKRGDYNKLATERISSVCDLGMLRSRLRELSQLYRDRDYRRIVFALRASLVRNLAGMCHPELHSYSRVGTKRVVEDYVNVVSHLLKVIASAPSRSQASKGHLLDSEGRPYAMDMTLEEKLTFFNEARHAYGKTALMLSGGAALGLHHFGVVKALLEQNLLPKVVCGTSVGALVASFLGIFDDVQLRSILESEAIIDPRTDKPFSFRHFDEGISISRRLRRLFTKGFLADVRMLQDCLRKNYGDLTFQEAYVRTKRILNITVCSVRSSSDPPLLLNYLTAPHVLIWSAAAASCALPMVFAPVELFAKDANGSLVPYQPDGVRWIDGSITSDVPLARIGELFNVNHFIVSQTNPHIIPRGSPVLQTRLALLVKSEIQFRYWQLLQLRLVPRLISSMFPHFVQPYEGDVTIMPDVTLRDLTRLFKNPTSEEVHDCIRRGEKRTFPKIDCIRLHCLIERTLEAATESIAKTMSIKEKIASESIEPEAENRYSARAPSWLWFDSSGPSPALEKTDRSLMPKMFGRAPSTEAPPEKAPANPKQNRQADTEFIDAARVVRDQDIVDWSEEATSSDDRVIC